MNIWVKKNNVRFYFFYLVNIYIFFIIYIYFFFVNIIMSKPIQTIGSRRQVMNGTAKKTSGGLTKSHLMMSHGRIVSKSKHFSAKKENRLVKYGFGTQKGKFGAIKLGTKKHRKKMRGGSMSSLNPADVNASTMIKDVAPQSFNPLDRALVGGRRRKHRRMRGGSGMAPMSSPGDASWNGDGLTNLGAGSTDVQMEAGMAGGRRHKMRGGTTSHRSPLMPAEVEQRALLA